MPAPVIHFNGYAGTGKLTIAKALQAKIPDSRLLDNHSLLDPALALFDRGTQKLTDLRLNIRATVFLAAEKLPATSALIFTDALDVSDVSDRIFADITAFAQRTRRPVHRVILNIHESENIRRLQNPERGARHKLIDVDTLRDTRANHQLFGADDPEAVHLDVTDLSPEGAADVILGRLSAL